MFLDQEFHKDPYEFLRNFKGANPSIWGKNALKLELKDQFILENHEKFSAREVSFVRKKLAVITTGKNDRKNN